MGCAKNLVDSEILITQLKGNQIDARHESMRMDPDVVVINTCGFIENAKQESIDAILKLAESKDKGDFSKLYVTGCLSERYKAELEKEIPQVDAFFGTRELPALLKRFNADYKQELIGERLITTAQHYAYLKEKYGELTQRKHCALLKK